MSIFNLEANNLDLTLICKYFIKIFLTWKSKLAYLKYQLGQISINSEHFLFRDQFGSSRWQIFNKNNLWHQNQDQHFEISNVPNFNKFWAFLMLGLIGV